MKAWGIKVIENCKAPLEMLICVLSIFVMSFICREFLLVKPSEFAAPGTYKEL